MAIGVFIADDHAVVREGLRLVLEAHPDIHVLGEASEGRGAVSEVRRLLPDVVIMDIAMPQSNGIEATLRLHELVPSVKVVILSMHSTTEHIFRALQAGARGYLLKESAGAEVVDAVRAVYSGGRYLSQKIAANVVDDYLREGQPASPLQALSRRELEVVQLVAEGRTSAEIAALLALSPKTVETYRSRLMQKLGVTDVPSLVKFAIQHGLTSLQ
jgi:DNA-binding NarL/FixJ family response regulator